MFRLFFIFLCCFFSPFIAGAPYSINLSSEQTLQLGNLIWKNEGQQKVEHLTTWNEKENFPSLGLGHFIWYPTIEKGPFKEQFPQLVHFMLENGVVLPPWLIQAELAPWKSRTQFYEQFDAKKLTQLRLLLSEQLALQVRFIILRLEKAIPLILASSNPLEQQRIHLQLSKLSNAAGTFALLDYVNFKGEGLSAKESYQTQGWGLKQVLLAMPLDSEYPLRSFGYAADEILTRRVKNAPRDEARWLQGWRKRVHAYHYLNLK